MDKRTSDLLDAARTLLGDLIDSEEYGPRDKRDPDDEEWPRDEDGDLWYPDVWALREACHAFDEPAGPSDIVGNLDSSERADLNEQLRKFTPPESVGDDVAASIESDLRGENDDWAADDGEGPGKFSVTAIEKFLVKTNYYGIEANSASEAEQICREGVWPYDEKEILDGDEEWIKTVSVERDRE